MSVFFILAILVDVKWYLIVIFICSPLMTDDGKHLFMSSLVVFVCVYLLCRNAYSDPVAIF